MDEFVVSTEDLNDQGYRILTNGIKLDAFLKNPVMFFNHDWGQVPIGKWTNLRKEGGKLIATPEFNEKDAFSLHIKNAVEGGFINATSVGVKPLKFSDDPKDLVAGQYRCTTTECELYEISFVGLPSNSNAVRLSAIQKDFEVPILKQKQEENMKKIALTLGLKESANEAEIVEAINVVKANKSTPNVEVLLALGRANGHVNDENVEKYRKLAKSDYETTFELIGEPKEVTAPASAENTAPSVEPVTLSAVMKEVQKANGTDVTKVETKAEEFFRLSKHNPEELEKIQKNDPKRFDELQKAYVLSKK